MRILFVSHAVPDSNGRGIERRAAQHLRTLSRLGEVTLVVPESMAATSEERSDAISRLDVHRLIRRPDLTRATLSSQRHAEAKGRLARAWAALHRRAELDQAVPPEYRAAARETVSGDFDLIFAFRLASAIWLDSVLPARDHPRPPRIVDFDDVESVSMERRQATVSAGPLWRLLLRSWIGFTRRAERSICRHWERVMVCSDHDVALIRQRYGAEALAIPNTVPFGALERKENSGPFRLLFVGTFSYGPNVFGLRWFTDEVWPDLRAQLGDGVEFHALGFDASPEIFALGDRPGITIVSPADSLPPYYAAADAVIAPIFSGAGTRIKIIEAMAFERAVVTTTIGCEGLEVEDGKHLFIADTPEMFRDALLRLAKDGQARVAIAQNGFAFARDRYSPEVADRLLRAAIEASRDA